MSDQNVRHDVVTWKARLKANHQIRNHTLSQIDEMIQSDLHFAVVTRGRHVEWALDPLSSDDGYMAPTGRAASFEEALIDLRNAARKHYPDSVFAQINGYNSELEIDQRTAEDLAYELKAKHGDHFELSFDASDPDPYAAYWKCTIGDRGFGGYSAIEAMKSALASEHA